MREWFTLVMDLADAVRLTDTRIAAFREEVSVPGVAYALVKDGELVHALGVGEVRTGSGRVPGPDDVFRIASMTKSFTASAVLLLRDRGALRLDDGLAQHLPWTSQLRSPDGGADISIRDLLTMNAGFPTDDPWGDRHESLPLDDFDAMVAAGMSFARPPRTGFEYSNLGYALLGRVVAEVSGTGYSDFVARELLAPLAMASSALDVSSVPGERLVQGYAPVGSGLVPEPVTGPGAFSAMGGILSTVRDISAWVASFERSWHGKTPHPLGQSTVREMQEPQRLVATTVTPASDEVAERVVTTSYGYGLFVDDDQRLGRFVSHSGGYPGFGSHMRWHPRTGWGLVVLGNRTYTPASRAADGILCEIVAREDAGAPPGPAVPLWPQTLAAIEVVESLLRSWDDDLVEEHAAFNVDLDSPRTERRAAFERVRAAIGGFSRSDRPLESASPAHARWWLTGAAGSAWAEVRLTPELPPRIQTLTVAIGEPPAPSLD